MRPSTTQKCEICNEAGPVLFDARVRQGKYGAKGHWVFMCPSCHMIHGIGYDEDEIVIYERFMGRWMEMKEEYSVTPEDIRKAVSNMKSMVGQNDGFYMTLLGEIAVQLATMNRNMEVNNSLIKELLPKKQGKPEEENPDLIIPFGGKY